MKLREHDIRLQGEGVVLRPMTEDDWSILLEWNNDPDVLYYSDGDYSTGHDLQEVQRIYQGISQNAFCFIIEVDGAPVGECWLQQMNLKRILEKYPEKDCRRIDLMIGEKRLWGQGLGTDAIHTLTKFGFDDEKADIIFGLVGDYNLRSVKAFQKAGYRIDARIAEPPGGKARFNYDLAIRSEEYKGHLTIADGFIWKR